MSYVFDEWKSQTSEISMIMVVCLTLVAITKGQVGLLNKIGVVARAIVVARQRRQRSCKELESERLRVNTVCGICIFAILLSVF